MEVLKRKALRLISGCARSTLCADLYLEAAVIPLSEQFALLDAVLAEKYRRFPDGDPLYNLSFSFAPK